MPIGLGNVVSLQQVGSAALAQGYEDAHSAVQQTYCCNFRPQ